MFRRYNRWHSRFDQPDPYDGSYALGNPQSFNRYAYVNGDPVNFVDPSGLKQCIPWEISPECDSSGFGGWGGGYAGGNGWGSDPNPGRDIVAAGFSSDVRETYRVWDAEMCDNTGGKFGCQLLTSPGSNIFNLGFFGWHNPFNFTEDQWINCESAATDIEIAHRLPAPDSCYVRLRVD
jgi:hypothetical protein